MRRVSFDSLYPLRVRVREPEGHHWHARVSAQPLATACWMWHPASVVGSMKPLLVASDDEILEVGIRLHRRAADAQQG